MWLSRAHAAGGCVPLGALPLGSLSSNPAGLPAAGSNAGLLPHVLWDSLFPRIPESTSGHLLTEPSKTSTLLLPRNAILPLTHPLSPSLALLCLLHDLKLDLLFIPLLAYCLSSALGLEASKGQGFGLCFSSF